MNSSVAQCGDLEDSLEAASAKYTFLQQLKAYIADLCDMLQASTTMDSCCELYSAMGEVTNQILNCISKVHMQVRSGQQNP